MRLFYEFRRNYGEQIKYLYMRGKRLSQFRGRENLIWYTMIVAFKFQRRFRMDSFIWCNKITSKRRTIVPCLWDSPKSKQQHYLFIETYIGQHVYLKI